MFFIANLQHARLWGFTANGRQVLPALRASPLVTRQTFHASTGPHRLQRREAERFWAHGMGEEGLARPFPR